ARPAAPTPKGPRGPFWPRVFAAAIALAPAALLGWPLLAAGSTVLGGLVLAGSAALAVMPFLNESSPRVLRAAPGVLLAGVGVAGALAGLYWPAAFAVVGGWGLVRYGLGLSDERRSDAPEALSAFFGGVAALTGVALAAVHPAGWLALGATWLAYPASALLWIHLPSWVGRGVEQAFYGAWQSLRGLLRVAGAAKRDTNLYERLEAFGERHFRRSKWNAVWLIPGVWLPVMAVEAVKYGLAAAAGLWVGAVSAPVNLLWGSSSKLFGAGRATAYFAEASRFVFDRVPNGKASLFNKAEALVLPWTNSPSFAVRAGGSLALGVLQVGWSLAAAVAAPLLAVAGLVVAFGRMGAYDEKRHSPSSLSVNREDSPGAKPQEPTSPEPTEPAKAPLAPKLIAAALALLPAWYFGVPLLTGTLFASLGILYGLLVLPLAAMPFMGPKTPGFFKSLAARGMIYNGLFLLLSGHAIWVGAVAALAGWGFSRWVKSTADGKGGRFDGDSQIGAYFGALGSAVAVGAAWVGLAGFWGQAALVLAVLTSPFLLVNLPSWVGAGVVGVFRHGARSAGDAHDALSYWDEHTHFTANLSAQASYWLNQSYLHGLWLWLPWVPVRAVQFADFALGLAVGLAMGVLRAPLSFAAAATKDARRDGRAAAFFGGWLDAWTAAAEGGRARLERWVGALRPAVEEKTSASGRPTAKAFLAMLGVQLLELGWLVGVLLVNLSGAGLLWGLYKGARAALAWTPAPKA
ncbi:MAG: hypothetical protein HY079_14640, partial [Elusimicrobia bacterium]|nr:hypothetical protein [Elusimicrobiota bacterium]